MWLSALSFTRYSSCDECRRVERSRPLRVAYWAITGHIPQPQGPWAPWVTWAPLGPPRGPALCLAKDWLQVSRLLWSAKAPWHSAPHYKDGSSVTSMQHWHNSTATGRQSPWEPMPDLHDWVTSHTQPGKWITCHCNKSEVVFTHVCICTTWERKENRGAHLGKLGEGRCWTTWNNTDVQAFTSHHTVMVQRLAQSESNLKAK